MWNMTCTKLYGETVRKLIIRRNLGSVNTNSPIYSTSLQNPCTISEILNKVKSRDGLPAITPHIEHLIGRAAREDPAGAMTDKKDMVGLDIADKTQFILQSSHPVRYMIEREIKKLNGNASRNLNYHNWLTIFGRSLGLQDEKSEAEAKTFEEKLKSIACAAECGMFSSDIHQTVVNIPSNLEPASTRAHFNLGNKYAVLVGDYFAIRCIFFAEQAKNSRAFLSIIRGVEEFTSAPFASPLLESQMGYPMVLSPKATIQDWITYNWKASGYFSGGLYAILTLMSNKHSSHEFSGHINSQQDVTHEIMKKFVLNMTVLLKALIEIRDLGREDDNLTVSPFTLTSLPAVLYQRRFPGIFEFLRGQGYDFNIDDLKQLREEIRTSTAINEAKDLLRFFAKEATDAYSAIAVDPFYSSIFNELVDALVSECVSSSASTATNSNNTEIDNILALDQTMTHQQQRSTYTYT